MTLDELYQAQAQMAKEIDGLAHNMTGCLEAPLDREGEQGAVLIQVIHSIEHLCRLIVQPVPPSFDPHGFPLILDDYVCALGEIERPFYLKRTLQSIIYSQEMQLIDLQANLIISQTEIQRDFDSNYEMSSKYIKMRDDLRKNKELYNRTCKSISQELDRIDLMRMSEIEENVNKMVHDRLQMQDGVLETLKGFLSSTGYSNGGAILSPPPPTSVFPNDTLH